MFCSAALFTFRLGTTDAQIDALADALGVFVSRLDGVVDFMCGSDLRLRHGTDDFAVLASFASEASLRTYLTHPDHADVVARFVTPIVATKHNVQFRTPPAAAVIDDSA